jgi:hypothetical protein
MQHVPPLGALPLSGKGLASAGLHRPPSWPSGLNRFGLKRAEGKSDAEILAISQSASILPGRLLEAPCLD